MLLDASTVGQMAPAKIHKATTRLNSLDFHRTEDRLVTAGDDKAIRMYDTNTGEEVRQVWTKKYGAACITFTHAPDAVVYASRNEMGDHSLRYHSLHDNKFLRYFVGHTDNVCGIAMSAKSDHFLSASCDKTIRLWDLRAPSCQGILECQQMLAWPTVAYDEQGLVFCAAPEIALPSDGQQSSTALLRLYDARTFDKGPFDTFMVECDGQPLTSVQFSPDGKLLLAMAASGRMTLLDAYEGQTYATILAGVPLDGTPLQPTFSPDGQFILCGNADGSIRVWTTGKPCLGRPGEPPPPAGAEVVSWAPGNSGVPHLIKWAPRKMLVATGCTMGTLGLWLPRAAR